MEIKTWLINIWLNYELDTIDIFAWYVIELVLQSSSWFCGVFIAAIIVSLFMLSDFQHLLLNWFSSLSVLLISCACRGLVDGRTKRRRKTLKRVVSIHYREIDICIFYYMVCCIVCSTIFLFQHIGCPNLVHPYHHTLDVGTNNEDINLTHAYFIRIRLSNLDAQRSNTFEPSPNTVVMAVISFISKYIWI